jgi:hypothetical protein
MNLRCSKDRKYTSKSSYLGAEAYHLTINKVYFYQINNKKYNNIDHNYISIGQLVFPRVKIFQKIVKSTL